MKLVSWNVNGLRASWNRGLFDYLDSTQPDVLCLQEIKVKEDQLTHDQKNPLKYHSFWFSADKPGYSGVATYTKREPISVQRGIGDRAADTEGRVLTLEFTHFFLINSYFPNSQRDHARLDVKLRFCKNMLEYCKKLRDKKSVVICGDFNIAHKEIDLRNPKSNKDNAGFLPEERAWMDDFLAEGFLDGFREFEPGPDFYTWWSYRPGVREKNVGWRIDYHCFDEELRSQVRSASIHREVKGSDHCPIELKIK